MFNYSKYISFSSETKLTRVVLSYFICITTGCTFNFCNLLKGWVDSGKKLLFPPNNCKFIFFLKWLDTFIQKRFYGIIFFAANRKLTGTFFLGGWMNLSCKIRMPLMYYWVSFLGLLKCIKDIYLVLYPFL